MGVKEKSTAAWMGGMSSPPGCGAGPASSLGGEHHVQARRADDLYGSPPLPSGDPITPCHGGRGRVSGMISQRAAESRSCSFAAGFRSETLATQTRDQVIHGTNAGGTVWEKPDERVERGYVLLQAAIAEGALGDIPTAYRRADELAALDTEALTILARVAADFVCRLSLASGPDRTTSKDDNGNPVNIEDRSPERRVFTRRMMAAWSVKDTETFSALLHAACADGQRRHSHLADLFRLTIDEAELHGTRAGRPFSVVRQMNKSILKEGLGEEDWNR